MQIALLSMPWAIFSRPSIQLGVLKSYVERESDCSVLTIHPYLQIAKQIGIENYNRIADSSWAGEAIFSGLLYPHQFEQAKETYQESLEQKDESPPSFEIVSDQIRHVCDALVTEIPWQDYNLIGFSLCFNQLFGSLYMAKRLKQLKGCPPIIFGGSSCGGELGTSLLTSYKQVDYIIDGEGEIPLTELCQYLSEEKKAFPESVLSREHSTVSSVYQEIKDLNNLPIPNYSQYFQQMKSVFPDSPFIPEIPLEFSRGCWWNKCTFCNLNLQWCGYRWKKASTVLAELDSLTRKHQSLDFTFTDNALPPKEAKTFFKETAHSELDHSFFAEIRSVTDPETFLSYADGGLQTIQVGIESLSSSLLNKMRKGVSAIENIAVMKYAQQAGITLEGNILIEFPCSTEDEVAETLDALNYVFPYNPLAPATFFLGYGSPVYKRPDQFNIEKINHHRKNRNLFPKEVLKDLTLLCNEYDGDRDIQEKLWKPVREKLNNWSQFHKDCKQKSSSSFPLSYRDGGTFLLIRQENPDEPTSRHRLTGNSREIYLFCDRIRTFTELTHRFNSIKESAILAFIEQLCQKRLMYSENEQVIALAVNERCSKTQYRTKL